MTCAISIDLDPIGHYYALHGLKGAPEDLACTTGLRRFMELADRHGFKGTIFVVGDQLDRPEFASILSEASRAGHEIANHTLSHRYDLSRQETGGVDYEIRRAHQLIEKAVGKPPAGFRAPGYNLSGEISGTLARMGYKYDSSAYSSYPYWMVKAAVMATSRLVGRRSSAILNPIASLFAPVNPYRPDVRSPYSKGDATFVEMPVSVSPLLRLPLIGTAFILAGGLLARILHHGVDSRPFLNLEFHGIDFLGRDEVGTGLLAVRQPDARMELDAKLGKIETLLDRIREREFLTLDEAAGRLAAVSVGR
jgi:peptidoglycan-N-acetylglucosamine deacetylase